MSGSATGTRHEPQLSLATGHHSVLTVLRTSLTSFPLSPVAGSAVGLFMGSRAGCVKGVTFTCPSV